MKDNIYTDYICNNWLKEDTSNTALTMIDAKGGAIAMNQSGALLYRLSPNDPFTISKDYKAISQVFSNFLDKKVELITQAKSKKDESEDDSYYVASQDLKMVVDTKFEPHTPSEFIEAKNGLCYLNKYIPSSYMLQDCDNYQYDENDVHAIFSLIEHLSDYNNQKFHWIINWLAYFIQGVQKSQVALVLRGEQGAGKGILMNEVIKPLIGEAYTKTINDKTLNSQYLGGLVEDVLFFNLDEISVEKAKNASIKNFLKALVTNETITAEKKYKTLNKESKIYGQTLITSNEAEVIEVEPSDRRYIVFNTAGNLKYVNFLGYGSYENLSSAIKNELAAFLCYSKNYRVDVQSANTPLMTPEKEQLISLYMQKQEQSRFKLQPKLNKLQKSIQEFAYAIRFKDFNYFESIRFDAPELHTIVIIDLRNNLFRISNLLATFKVIYGNSFKTTSELLRALQNYDWQQFGMNRYVTVVIGDTEEECINLISNSYVGY